MLSSQLHLLQQRVTNNAPLCRLHSLTLHSSVSLSGCRCFIFIFVHASFCLLQQCLCLIYYFSNSLHPVSCLISAQFSIQVLLLSSPFHLFCLQSSFDLLQILSYSPVVDAVFVHFKPFINLSILFVLCCLLLVWLFSNVSPVFPVVCCAGKLVCNLSNSLLRKPPQLCFTLLLLPVFDFSCTPLCCLSWSPKRQYNLFVYFHFLNDSSYFVHELWEQDHIWFSAVQLSLIWCTQLPSISS